MLLSNLLKSVGTKYRNINIKGISFDSRKVKKKDIFFAIKGTKVSGDIFIKEALLKGASIVVIDKKTKPKNNKKSYLLVPDVRKSLTEVCSNFYKKKPSNIIAVTGTNGKSSVVDFFYQILTLNKMPVASIGTLGIFSKNFKKKTNLTSIDPISLHKNIQTLKKNGIENLILEASSHGLDQKRLDNLNFRIGIFTNLSHDHLDYHKNMKTYLNTKMYLFKSLLKKNSKIITDEDNKEFNVIKNIANKKKIKKITIGTNSWYIRFLDNRYDQTKQIVTINIRTKIFIFITSLIGFFQIKNLLMAILAAMNSGLNQNKILSQIHKIKPVRGRLEHVAKLKNNSNIIIDFAHTPDALEQSLIALKKQFKKKITIVFGCGGDRDKKKRLTMGKIAKKYCQKIFVTDDNPRNENPQKIRNSIIRGCKNLAFDIGDRKEAIKTAMQQLGPNEILLITGKGHEKTQDYGKNILSFSDHKIVKEIIKKKLSFKNTSWANFIVQRAFKNKNIKNIDYNGVSINTKTIKKNNLFFAIKGKNND
jgi:murE/murF fusion protein